ncbi:MAG: N-acetyl-gamma-glutamyl-phosphate reductase [Bacteroidota bacterium]
MIKVGIIGAAGYTASELIRVLLYHPDVELDLVQSESQHGKAITEVHRDLIGTTDLVFESSFKKVADMDVIFLCKGHGESEKILEAYPDLLAKKIIDLSHDYRLSGDHDFIYGLPEINKAAIKAADHCANPGCFATAIQLGLLPAFFRKVVGGPVNISGITGSTGAGQSLSATSHFSWRSNNASVYKPLVHQHLQEINETLQSLDHTYNSRLLFVPYRGAFTRGIITTSHFETALSGSELHEIYVDYYSNHPFALVTNSNPDLKMVVNSNKGVIFPQVIDGVAVVVSVIDNLVKGASGQAVQNMNLMFHLEESQGLNLKHSAF